MEPVLIVGIIIFAGFTAGELSNLIGLPKVTGYIIAGIALNPGLTSFVPESFVAHTSLITNMALSFITFSVGGTLVFSRIKALGKTIVLITLFEAFCAFLFVSVFFVLLGPFLFAGRALDFFSFFLPLSLILASLASPTDPSAILAVKHEYRAEGEVTSTIMGVVAFDDIFGIICFSLAVSAAGTSIAGSQLDIYSGLLPIARIIGSVVSGCIFGFLLNVFIKIIKKETEGVLITLILGLLSICFGVARLIGVDELLSTMTMGVVVVNYNVCKEKIFSILERYTEELIFLLFFTISGMHLNFSVLASNYFLIIMFIIFRFAGKFTGTVIGSKISKASVKVKKYTAGGLLPQGGIVIGLALLVKQNPAFKSVADIIINVVIGATVIHEILGPIAARFALKKAGEIGPSE